ncbi:MAG TPA: helix-turn-helix transcriptional regulator [Bacteroidia bacterium]|nr:helix-turn-helix transcriptional regulator [Bacteroidia bacterium]
MPHTFSTLPTHSLLLNEPPVQVRRIEHKNPYDFTTEHRHDYFEIFFFETGGGIQLIDFKEYPVVAKSCYIVFPQQIHLLRRAKKAHGRLVQFREEVLASSKIRLLLKQFSFEENAAVIFEKEQKKLNKTGLILNLLEEATQNKSAVSIELSLQYLQALILQLLDFRTATSGIALTDDRKLLFEFQQLLEAEYHENRIVTQYAQKLNTSEKKLALTIKKHLGISPLQAIHDRILLEAKRLLLFETTSHKEISFQLGFDSPASFSLFIKNKTGFSPSELNSQLVKIHK